MRPEHIHKVIRILRKEVAKLAVPVVGQYAYDPFETLISCLLSLRTQDATTYAASERLFKRAKSPRGLLKLSQEELRRLIYPVSFYKTKALRLHQIAQQLIDKHGGKVPGTMEELLALPGVGRKTANLVITLAFRKPGICVDTHVHRIPNRWGYLKTKSPDESEAVLRERLPKAYWMEFNDLLVPWGQFVCRPLSPWCSKCAIRSYCRQVGVGRTR
jgi:endonuclease III